MVVGLFLFVFLTFYGVESAEGCIMSTCSSHNQSVLFPFRIEGTPAEHYGYGYPEVGFDLSIFDNETVLEQVNSWKLFILEMGNQYQAIYAEVSEGRFPRWMTYLRLPPYEFKVPRRYVYQHFTLFNCSSTNKSLFYAIPCLGKHVYAYPSYDPIANDALVNCTKLYDISPVSPYNYYGFRGLSWSEPSPACTICEVEGKHCISKIKTTASEIQYNGSATEYGGELVPTHSIGSLKRNAAIGATLGSLVLLTIAVIASKCMSIYNKMETELQLKIENFLNDYKSFKPSRYSYADIKRITNHFKDELGKGAYGTVYRGNLSNEILVAVKVLNSSNGNGEEFVNEVGAISRIQHANVVRLIGFCADGFRRALVYEYLPNDTLNKFISSAGLKNRLLGWRILRIV